MPLLTISFDLSKYASAGIALLICFLALWAVYKNWFNTKPPDHCDQCAGFTAPLDSSLGTAITLFIEIELLVVTAVILTVFCDTAGGSRKWCMAATAALGTLAVAVVAGMGKVLTCGSCQGKRYDLFGFTLASTRQHIM